MRILFLTNNTNTENLYKWLTKDNKVTLSHNLNFEGEYDLIVSYNFKHIIPAKTIRKYKGKIVNLHISYLPWGRGVSPLFWAVVSKEPIGVTIHFIDEGIDTGDIIVQKRVCIFDNATMRDMYDILQEEIQDLFKKNFLHIKNLVGSYHSKADFESIKHILEPEGWDITIDELRRRYDSYNTSTRR